MEKLDSILIAMIKTLQNSNFIADEIARALAVSVEDVLIVFEMEEAECFTQDQTKD